MKLTNTILVGAVALAVTAVTVSAQEWSRFRGPNGSGVSDAKSIPVTWEDKDLNWKIALPGTGHSSPVLWGGRLFLTSSDEKQGGLTLMCIDSASGKILWSRAQEFGAYKIHKFNSFSSSTPVVDATQVYVTWITPDHHIVKAFTHEGKAVWEKDLGAFDSQHGLGASSIIYKGKLIIPNEQRGESFLIALDPKDGSTIWKEARTSGEQTAYSTPTEFIDANGKALLIFNSTEYGISAVDPDNGKLMWNYKAAFDKRSCSSPVVGGGVIIGSCGSGGGGNYVVAIKPGDAATGKAPAVAWELRRSAPYVPTGVYWDGHFYFFADSGIATCVEAATGEVKWQERVGRGFFGSPVLVDGRLYCIATDGEIVVVKAAPEFAELGRMQLKETTHTTPAISGGRMYIRTVGHLLSVGGAHSG